MNEAENIYLNRNEHYRAVLEVQTREDRFIERVKREFPLHEILPSNPILQHLRSIKEPEEIELLQKRVTSPKRRRRLLFRKTWSLGI